MTTKEQVNAFITSCEKCGQDKKYCGHPARRIKALREKEPDGSRKIVCFDCGIEIYRTKGALKVIIGG